MVIRRVGSKWVLFSKKKIWNTKKRCWERRVLGRHPSYKAALRQERAIWARRGRS